MHNCALLQIYLRANFRFLNPIMNLFMFTIFYACVIKKQNYTFIHKSELNSLEISSIKMFDNTEHVHTPLIKKKTYIPTKEDG